MIFILPALVLLCFVPVSIPTPIGFLSVVDVAIAVAALYTGIVFMQRRGAIDRHSVRFLLASIAVYVLFLGSTLAGGGNFDVSALLKYFTFLVIIPFICATVKSPMDNVETSRMILKSIATGALLLCIFVFIQILRGEFISTTGAEYYVKFFGQIVHKNLLGSLLIFGFIASSWLLVNDKEYKYIIHVLGCLTVTLLIGNRSSFIVDLVFLVAVISLARKSLFTLSMGLITIAIVVSLAFVASTTDYLTGQLERIASLGDVSGDKLNSASARLYLWDYAWQLIKEKPFFGHGFGNFKYIAANWLNGRDEPHNAFLQLLYAVGTVGTVGVSGLILIGLTSSSTGTQNIRPLRLMVLANIVNAMVGIIWVRGDGHLFWLTFFAMAMRTYSVNVRPSLSEASR